MDPHVHYVTQQGIYGVIRLGRLTDARIRKYEAMGYYGKEARDARLAARNKPKKHISPIATKKSQHKLMLESLIV